MTQSIISQIPSSFRDPAGFLYRRDGVLLRQVNESYAADYDACVKSGLFEALIGEDYLIRHEEVDETGIAPGKYRVLEPEELPYVSYPYEWSFSQLKDAALLTLRIQSLAIEHGMVLKDASAYNVQFRGGKPVFIDTLSFKRYVEGEPWIAYRQFCQHFLAPLALMAKCDLRLRQLTSRYIDGVPLDLASGILPMSSYFSYSIFAHIHMHAKSQTRHQDAAARNGQVKAKATLSKSMLSALVASLSRAVEKLPEKDVQTEWGDYYQDTNYSDDAMSEKEKIVARLAEKYLSGEKMVHDLGANTGRFSHIVSRFAQAVVAHDIDEMAVERHHRGLKMSKSTNVLPLILDLSNPTADIGWDLRERSSFHERANGSAALALAIIHHLCISNNVPLLKLAEFFSGIFNKLIIEFVPKDDSQVQRLLATREDIFDEYDQTNFERIFSQYFDIQERCAVSGSTRVVFAMTKRT